MTGKPYPNGEKELRETSNNRLKRGDVDALNFEANFSECEGLNRLNSKYDEFEFTDRKDALINRLFERRKSGHVGRHPKGKFKNIPISCIIY